MTETPNLKILSEKKATSRRELKCYVDSWIGPISACPPPRVDSRSCVYIFAIPGFEPVKIGSTAHPIQRQYQLRIRPPTSPINAPSICRDGYFVHLEPCYNSSIAFKAEKLSHRLLATEAWPARSRHAATQTRIEWFGVTFDIAVKTVMAAVANVSNDIPPIEDADLIALITTL